ncbi:MAG: hypothetical protein OK456_10450 [Thaumarchaeota archaeon]|nr:hypothetical protein [Nitrososphaerota archaeon]
MIEVDCAELSSDEKLALASEISDRLEGKALALVKQDSIVLDQLTDERLDVEVLRPIVVDFISRRKDAAHYSFDVHGQKIVVHSADPIAALRNKAERTLPGNLMQCPFCWFVTQYEGELALHMKSHQNLAL